MSAPEGHGANETRKATINGLAVVGFGAIIVGGMLLAVYAAKYVPDALSRLSSAVYLSTDTPKNETDTTKTTDTTPAAPVIFAPATETPAAPKAPSTPTTPSLPDESGYRPATTGTTYQYQNGPRLYGLSDLALTNVQTGYFRSGTFYEDDRVSSGRDLGLRFRVENKGTNLASAWRVRVRVEGESDAIAYGGTLYPNGYQDFTLRVTDPRTNRNLEIEIDVDYTNAVYESNENNNDRTVEIDSRGGSSSSSSRNVSCDIWASDMSVDSGDRITLYWDTSGNPDRATINQGIGRVDEDGGSERVRVTRDTTFRLTVENDRDSDTCSVTVRAD